MQSTSVLLKKLAILLVACYAFATSHAQPEPCGVDEMTSTCLDACVVCDIDGFTGRNDLTIQGQTFGEFCTTIFHNMSYIAFIAGTEDISLEVSVSNCTSNFGVEIGIFESLDCSTFTPVTACNTDVPPNGTATFSNTVPLVVGQHYYLIMDGSRGDICDWTFNVLSGSTLVGELTDSGPILGPLDWCPGTATTYSASPQSGATFFEWTVDGVVQGSSTTEFDYTFDSDGTYEICVSASNVCDEAPPTCTLVEITQPSTLLVETICANECIDVAGETICVSGIHQFEIPLANGCDSLVILDLTVLSELEETIDLRLCDGDSFEIGTTSYTTSGSFIETIPNFDGCDSTIVLNLTVIDCELIATVSAVNPTCNGDRDGSISITLNNGIPPFTYQWKNIRNTSVNGSGTLTSLDDIVLQNLSSGTYEVVITDSLGDDVVFVEELTDPPVLAISIDAVDRNGFGLSCHDTFDGEATAVGSGGIPPYSFLWSNAAQQATISSQPPGLYVAEVTDGQGCVKVDSVTLIAPAPIEFLANFIDPDCSGLETGVVELISIEGGAQPYSFSLNGGEYTEIESFVGLGGGLYQLNILDGNGCMVDSNQTLIAPEIPTIYMGPNAEVDLGETVFLSAQTTSSNLTNIQWTSTEGDIVCDTCLSTSALPLNSTEYILSVTSVDNCVTRDSLTVVVNKIRDLFVPNAFSPNGDGTNDFLFAFATQAVSSIRTFKVFNRWGDQVFAGYDLPPSQIGSGWDGSFRGKAVGNGVYVWFAEVEFLDGEVVVFKGDVTILK